MNEAALHHLLDLSYEQYNRPDFKENDPISIPHRFRRKEDIEISAFFTALIAWGRRDIIIRNASHLMDLMEGSPYEFVLAGDPNELSDFVHRTFNGQDGRGLVLALRAIYQGGGSLEQLFAARPDEGDVFHAIVRARNRLLDTGHIPRRSHKHLANPAVGASAKRINMYLRWMVRQDACGVDFGIWRSIQPAQLICPLDIHTGTVARKLGLLDRKQSDWKAAVALTGRLRAFCPDDPVKYDFSLFGLGVYGVL